MNIALILLAALAFVLIFNYKKLGHYLEKETDKITEMNESDTQVEPFAAKFRQYDSDALLEMLENNPADTLETRAIKKVLAERNTPFMEFPGL